MSVITFPTNLDVSKFTWGQQRRDMAYTSSFGSQAVGISGPLWIASLEQLKIGQSNAGAWQSLILRLAGKTNQLELWNLALPAPLGTMRGTLTLSGAHAQAATILTITGGAGQASKTLKAGDYLGLGSGTSQQVVMVTADATANGSGVISVDISATPLRTAFISGASVVWDKPKALFRQTTNKASWSYAPGSIVSGIALDLVEDWRS